jgi:hypothetical protein
LTPLTPPPPRLTRLGGPSRCTSMKLGINCLFVTTVQLHICWWAGGGGSPSHSQGSRELVSTVAHCPGQGHAWPRGTLCRPLSPAFHRPLHVFCVCANQPQQGAISFQPQAMARTERHTLDCNPLLKHELAQTQNCFSSCAALCILRVVVLGGFISLSLRSDFSNSSSCGVVRPHHTLSQHTDEQTHTHH